MLKNDKWIKQQSAEGMITPFEPAQVRSLEDGKKAISYGTSSYGYDLRLSDAEFWVFHQPFISFKNLELSAIFNPLRGWLLPEIVIDPKNFDRRLLKTIPLRTDKHGSYFVIPGNSFGLGVSKEFFAIPENVMTLCTGKSTYARVAIHPLVTPGEAGWQGYFTLEFSNTCPLPCKIYANEGVLQLIFWEGEPCETTYADRSGKYQNQIHKVTFAKV